MSYPRPIVVVDIIGTIVSEMAGAIVPDGSGLTLLAKLQAVNPNIQTINYQYGPPLEIYETLAEMSASNQALKYPLVALFQPFDENKGGATGIDGKDNLRIIIAMWNDATSKAADRYTKNFRPILYPIYAELLNQLATSRSIAVPTYEKMPHKKRDWPYWDNDGKNPVVDCVDIIEISNLELNFRLKNC